MMWAVKLLMKRPTDKTIRTAGIAFGLIYILATGYNFIYQAGSLENNFFGVVFNESQMQIVAYVIVALGLIPLIRGIANISILSRGYTRIAQIIFGVVLFYIATKVVESPNLEVDLLLVLMGIYSIVIGISGKMITQSGLKHGQKITKIRV